MKTVNAIVSTLLAASTLASCGNEQADNQKAKTPVASVTSSPMGAAKNLLKKIEKKGRISHAAAEGGSMCN